MKLSNGWFSNLFIQLVSVANFYFALEVNFVPYCSCRTSIKLASLLFKFCLNKNWCHVVHLVLIPKTKTGSLSYSFNSCMLLPVLHMYYYCDTRWYSADVLCLCLCVRRTHHSFHCLSVYTLYFLLSCSSNSYVYIN